MSQPKPVLKGVVHGKTIELEHESGLPDGQAVNVTIQPVAEAGQLAVGEGLRQSFGAWAEDTEELDRYLEWNRRQRKIGRAEVGP
jgi:hypothetical protein